ncbi:MAG: DNA topoisomerase IB, partial [Chloroflexota bacterium]|nr:DNA topoisomerase IB [Chloroflexota bacterium]
LQECGPCEDEAQAKKNVLKAIDEVAEHLANTRAVCRKYYIHPKVLDCYQNGTMLDLLERSAEEIEGLHPEECAMLTLLREIEGTA